MWHEVQLPARSGPTSIQIAEHDVLVAHVDGRWFAVENRCSHADCAFSTDGELEGMTLICDCHGSEFDLGTGEALVMPAVRPIRTFPVRENDGALEVEL